MELILFLSIVAFLVGTFTSRTELKDGEKMPIYEENYHKMIESMNNHRRSIGYKEIEIIDEK